jgi:hypothetical protein
VQCPDLVPIPGVLAEELAGFRSTRAANLDQPGAVAGEGSVAAVEPRQEVGQDAALQRSFGQLEKGPGPLPDAFDEAGLDKKLQVP